MQTFLPYPDFEQSAKCLDYRRLGKQRVECKQILNALHGRSKGWSNHPATQMWAGYESALVSYYNYVVVEWVRRGYKNNMPVISIPTANVVYPSWFGNKLFHDSHKSNLLRKDQEFYSQWGWDVPTDLEYLWPSA